MSSILFFEISFKVAWQLADVCFRRRGYTTKLDPLKSEHICYNIRANKI